MAFIDFSGRFVPVETRSLIEPAAASEPLRDVQPIFSRLEFQVLALSRRDPASSVRPAGSLDRKLARLLGLRPHNPLADPRLETLRRFAVTVRCRGAKRAERLAVQLLGMGFSGHQIAAASGMAVTS